MDCHPTLTTFLLEYGDYTYNLRDNLIRLPTIGCEFGDFNAKYQMHLRLRTSKLQ